MIDHNTAIQSMDSSPKTAKKKSLGRKLLLFFICLFSAVLLFSGSVICIYILHLQQADENFQSLASIVAHPSSADDAVDLSNPVLPHLRPLYQRNSDLFGWITIPGTKINYPVMYCPQDPQKYLRADFQQDYSYAGTPFLDASCLPDSDNLLIYAHNMLDGSMFQNLLEYEQETYWQEHPVIFLDTLFEQQQFEVLAAFYDQVYLKSETCFKFYQFIDAAHPDDYNNAIQNFKEKALYDTGVTAAYGDQLLTLITCAYHTENGRFVVVAKRIP